MQASFLSVHKPLGGGDAGKVRQQHRLSAATDGNRWLPDAADVWYYNKRSADGWQNRTSDEKLKRAAEETWRWCSHFVVPLNLCPWAVSSIGTAGAVQFYLVPSSLSQSELEMVVENVSRRFVKIASSKGNLAAGAMMKVAIAFIIVSGKRSQRWSDFTSFYSWFINLEDFWIDRGEDSDERSVYNLVTLAAFHPKWAFCGNDDDENSAALDFEKKSPYPAISLVWTAGIDAAGPEATDRIGEHNKQLLEDEMTLSELTDLYNRAVFLQQDDSMDTE